MLTARRLRTCSQFFRTLAAALPDPAMLCLPPSKSGHENMSNGGEMPEDIRLCLIRQFYQGQKTSGGSEIFIGVSLSI